MTESKKLWDNLPPLHIVGGEIPTIKYYPTKKTQKNGAVIIFSGGGYRWRAPHEGEPYALRINEMGVDAFLVEYRVFPSLFPAPLLDARRAVRYVRAKAEEFNINPEKIAVMGSSAGGHLASLVSTYKGKIGGEGIDALDDIDPIPNAQILCYPVTDIESHQGSYEHLLGDGVASHEAVTPTYLADKDTPPAFIWHTSSDPSVDVKGSYRYATRLSELCVPVEMHIYPIGGHGVGLANGLYGRATVEYLQRWTDDLGCWLKLCGFVNE